MRYAGPVPLATTHRIAAVDVPLPTTPTAVDRGEDSGGLSGFSSPPG